MSWRSPLGCRVVVVGDVGGHEGPFFALMRRLGVKDARLPDGIVVIQLGDLVGGHAPSTEKVIAYTDKMITNSEGRWVQLMGNWEANYIKHGHKFGSRRMQSEIDHEHTMMMLSWWSRPVGSVAAVVRFRDGSCFVVTHAGITQQVWVGLGRKGAIDTARVLNEAGKAGEPFVFRPGRMMHQTPQGGSVGSDPGPLWADAGELWGSWKEVGTPFHQVVGHTSPWDWRTNGWSQYQAGEPLLEWAEPVRRLRHTRYVDPYSLNKIIHIDNQLWARSPVDHLRPFEVEGAEVLVP